MDRWEICISEKMLTVQIVVSLVWLIICGSANLEFWSCKSNSDCLNGGNCSLPDGRCVCDSGFDEVGTCSGSECHHGGSCFQLSPNTYKCLCPYSYDGTFCETPYNFMELGIQLIKRYLFMIRKAHRLIKRAYVDRNVRKSISQGIQKEPVKQEETRSIKSF
ncbi:Protocadherin Fat 1 [Trichinella britovi]|uniref:Protocadherin Fat 1 n=1 Tax=Trichinella britovi TaxID=45882 RepID=A0A0V1CHL1_TRIBR|nr:Protocadherin Fat 1 [Trichinella britovi]